MTPATWPCPLPAGGAAREYAVVFDKGRSHRLLIIPALFDESNRLRRFTVELMRRLDVAGIDSFLPDLPGCNESLQPLERQDTTDWTDAATAAARHFHATHALGIRGGCLFTPAGLPAWHYAPVKASAILRQLLRARILSAREAGREETRELLAEMAIVSGIELSGYRLGADFFRHFEKMAPDPGAKTIPQDAVGGSGLWLRAEPDENSAQADALSALLAQGLAG